MVQDLVIKSSVVRNNFSEFLDTVIRDKPQVINRNRDYIIAFNYEHLNELIKYIRFHIETEIEEDNTITASIVELPELVVNEETKDKAISQLVNLLVEYATEYLTNSFNLYFNSPNRKSHFPYVLKVAVQQNLEEVKKLFHDQY